MIKVGGPKLRRVQRVWDIYDDRLQFMSRDDAFSLDDSLTRGMFLRLRWFGLLLLRLPLLMLIVLRVVLSLIIFGTSLVGLGGPKIRKARRNFADPLEGGDVSLYHDVSTAPLLGLRRRFRLVANLLAAVIRDGVSFALSVELVVQWDAILRVGAIPLVSDVDFVLASHWWSWSVLSGGSWSSSTTL